MSYFLPFLLILVLCEFGPLKVINSELEKNEHEKEDADDLMRATLWLKEHAAGQPDGKTEKKSVGVEKVRVEANIAKWIASAQEKKNKLEEQRHKIIGLVRGSMGETTVPDGEDVAEAEKIGNALLEEIKEKAIAVKDVINEVIAKCTQTKQAVSECENVKAVIEFEKEFIEKGKDLKCLAMANWANLTRSIGTQYSTRKRAEGRQSARVARQQVDATRIQQPLWIGLFALPEEMKNVGSSVFEAKGGMRASITAINSEDNYNKINGHPQLRTLAKAAALAIKRGVEVVSSPFQGSAIAYKRFTTLLSQSVGVDLTSTSVLPKADWSKYVYGASIVMCNQNYLNVGWPHMGLMEVRVVLSGDVVFAGIPNDIVPGDSYLQKRQYIYDAGIMEVNAMIVQSGWYIKFNNGQTPEGMNVLTIPTGCVVLWAGKDVKMLRWSLVGDDRDIRRGKAQLQNLHASFSDLKEPNMHYLSFATHLGLRV